MNHDRFSIPDPQVGPKPIGQLVFETPQTLQGRRALDGLAFKVPASFELSAFNSAGQQPVIWGIRCDATFRGEHVGSAKDPRVWHGGANPANCDLWLQLSAAAVHRIERLRDGRAPRFDYELWMYEARWGRLGDAEGLVTPPMTRYGGTLSATYNVESWNELLSRTGFSENVVVEIPVPACPDAAWAEVWAALRQARTALTEGGGTNWSSVVSQCRHALDRWSEIAAPDHAGWQPPPRAQREARTERQRLDHLRWALLQYAHLESHSTADNWTRKQAVLVLATLCALLSASEP